MTRSTSRKTHTYFLLIVVMGLSADAAEIRLKRTVNSHGSLILLGDVAEVKDGDPEVVKTLERIELFPAPSGQQSRTLRLREVRELLRLNGVDLTACQFSGAETCRVLSQPAAKPAEIFPSKPITPPSPKDIMILAARSLSRGHVVSETDVVLRPVTDSTRKIASIRGRGVVQQTSDVVGYELTRPVSANQPFEISKLRRQVLVRRGEIIRVTARASGVTIRTSARAMEQGSQGDLIMLQSQQNREKFLGRVTGLQQAEVYASGPVVQAAPVGQAGDDRTKTGRGRNLRR